VSGSASGRPPRVFVVLPAFNEEANLGGLLERLDEAMAESGLPYDVIVVDDGSRDGTAELVRRLAERLPIEVITHPQNLGLGATTRDGLVRAAERASPRDVIVTMDADETHTPGLILRMLRMLREGHDVVIASRFQSGARVFGVPWHRRLMTVAASLVFRLLFPTPGVRDFTCGYRAYRGAVLKEAIARYGPRFVEEDGFQCMVDILLKLRELPLVFGEVPLILRYDLKQGKSKMDVWRTARRTLALVLRRRLGRAADRSA